MVMFQYWQQHFIRGTRMESKNKNIIAH